VFGRIECNDGEKDYVGPVNYVYDRICYSHSVWEMKIEMMRRNPNMCFEIHEMKSFNSIGQCEAFYLSYDNYRKSRQV
jgi:nitroimidazol reductase NimA-like FMN-containing flavoprotein (pyridoxamine 5'-phosphate oxidase superfamily)